MSTKPTLSSLKRHRTLINASLSRFNAFWRTHGRIASIETICEWVVKSSLLIDDYMFIQEQIHSFFIKGSAEEQAHIALTDSFEELFYELMNEAQQCIDFYMFRKATRY